jgi:hypothetical protein
MSRGAIAARIAVAAITALGCVLAAQTPAGAQTPASSTQTTAVSVGAQAAADGQVPQPIETSPATSPAGSRTISGVVVSEKNGQPLAGAEVSLSPAGSTASTGGSEEKIVVESNDEGWFSFENVADGRYRLRAARTGYITASYDEHPGGFSTAIVAGEGLTTTGLKMTLSPQAVIRGNISEDSGDPVYQGNVHLFRKDTHGTGKMVLARNANTDSEGNYEIGHLASGSYYLCVSATPWYASYLVGVNPASERPSVIDKAYATTCYPGVTDSSNAEPIEVGAGNRITANLTMHPVAAAHLRVEIPISEDTNRIAVPTLQQSLFGIQFTSPTGATVMRSEGNGGGKAVHTAVYSGIAPGEFTVIFQDGRGGGVRTASVNVEQGKTTISSSAITSAADVTGKIVMADGGALPEMGVAVTNMANERRKTVPLPAGSDGSFQFSALEQGDYALSILSSGVGVQILKVVVNGAESRSSHITVGSEPVTLTIVAARTVAAVSGVVEEGGKPAGGVFVVLVPTDTSMGSDALRPYQSDSDGSFTLPRVIAGEYTLVAIEEGWTLDWARPEALAGYLPLGKNISVRQDSGKIVLKEPIEAQPR